MYKGKTIITFIFAVYASCTLASGQTTQSQESAPGSPASQDTPVTVHEEDAPEEDFMFEDLDMVALGPEEGQEFDSYVIGDKSQSFTERRWITAFRINRTETTYSLWYSVRTTAEDMGYKFLNPGQEGSQGRRGANPTQFGKYQPVTMISWYDAVVWCNAFSEIYGLEPCYTYNGAAIRDATDTTKLDLCECIWQADGFRLPREEEWEYAARKTKSGFQGGDLMSGQVDENGNDDISIPEDEVSWTANNAQSTHLVGTAGTPFEAKAPPKPGSGNPNGSGLFDMSGNVLEFVWDWMANYKSVAPGDMAAGPEAGSQRVSRGGSWSIYTPFCYAGDRYSYDPNEVYNYFGFRIAQSGATESKAPLP